MLFKQPATPSYQPSLTHAMSDVIRHAAVDLGVTGCAYMVVFRHRSNDRMEACEDVLPCAICKSKRSMSLCACFRKV